MSPDLIYLGIYARFRHRDLTLREVSPGRADPQVVGPLAAQYAARYLHGEFTAETAAQIHAAHGAGLLIYAMDGYGLTFEDVCGVASPEVAGLLAPITPDNRLHEPKRHLDLRSALARADPVAQTVRLAEIVASARGVLANVPPDQLASHESHLKLAADRGTQLIRALHALQGKLAPQLDEALVVLARLSRAVDDARRAKKRR
jgi:hypothetical protein